MSYLTQYTLSCPTAARPDRRGVRVDERTPLNRQAFDGGAHVRVFVEDTSHRKLRRPWADVSEALAMLRVLFPSPLPLTVDTHNMAVTLADLCYTLKAPEAYSVLDSVADFGEPDNSW